MYKRALITGATSGLGMTLCHLLASKNIPLIITGRSKTKLEELAKELPVEVEIQAADLSDRSSRQALIEMIERHAPDLVINNAGFGLYGDALDFSIQEQMEILEVNGNSTLELTLAAARVLQNKKKGGVILNVASAAAFFSFPSFAIYAASKAFVYNFSQALNEELKSQGIHVLVSCPGKIDTDFQKRASKGKYEKRGAFMSSSMAAKLIWKQIEKRKAVSIFDWKTFIGVKIGRVFPQSILRGVLRDAVRRGRASQDT